MLKKRSQSADLTFRELKIYYAEKGHHLADQSFETNLNLRNADGEYNLLAELLANRNNTPFLFVKLTTRTAERNMASLQKKGKLVRNGSKRDGKWKVIG